MLVTSEQDPNIQHKLNITNIYTVGDVGGHKNVVYEAILNIDSQMIFDHEYTKIVTRLPVQTGTKTETVEETVYDEPIVTAPQPETIVKDGIVYFKATKKIAYGKIVSKEVEVPVYDISEPIDEETKITEKKEFQESKSFSIEFTTENITNFLKFENLTEEIVIKWIPDELINPHLTENTNILIATKDKFLNPLKYEKKRVDLPWTALENNN